MNLWRTSQFCALFVLALTAVGCARGGGRPLDVGAARDVPSGAPRDTGPGSLADADVGRVADAAVRDARLDARATDGGRTDARETDGGRTDARGTDAGSATADTATPADAGPGHPVTGALRCFTGQAVMRTGVFTGTTCGGYDLYRSACNDTAATENYFTAYGVLAGGHTGYLVEVEPADFVIQELYPIEVGFDCPTIAGACSSGVRRLETPSSIVQFAVERPGGGCGAYTLRVTAL